MANRVDLSETEVTGRTFEEYARLFRLPEGRERERILDAASGLSSFCAGAHERGLRVTACDQIYGLPPEVVGKAGGKGFLDFFRDYVKNRDRYVFDVFPQSRFESDSFPLVLSSYFLVYEEGLGCEFHRKAALEMLRICAGELRIAPLMDAKGRRSPLAGGILHEAFDRGFAVSIEKTEDTGGRTAEMLIIKKG